MGSNCDVRGVGKCYALRKMGSGTESRLDNIKDIKIMLGLVSELGCVRVHTLKLRFKRQIFMIFIVDYIYQKRFLKIENF